MSEQDESAEEPPSGGAMDGLVNAMSSKTPPLTPAERNANRFPVRPNRMATIGLGMSIGAVVCVGLAFTSLGCFAIVGALGLAVAGAICSIIGLWQARLVRSGYGVALAGAIIGLVLMLLTIIFQAGLIDV